MRKTLAAGTMTALLLLGVPAASAQSLAVVTALTKACATDIQTYCGKVEPGGGRLARCMELNEARVSPVCRATIVAAMTRVCGEDVARFCAKETSVGYGRLAGCLTAQTASLSGSCRSASNALAAR